MITPGRHRPLGQDAWNESAVRIAIEDIAADAIAHFHPDTFWPAHPSDSDDGAKDGDPDFYRGAAGVIWALDYLHRIGATPVAADFRSVLPKLMERTVIHHEASSPVNYEKHGSLLRGDMGAALLAMRLEPAWGKFGIRVYAELGINTYPELTPRGQPATSGRAAGHAHATQAAD